MKSALVYPQKRELPENEEAENSQSKRVHLLPLSLRGAEGPPYDSTSMAFHSCEILYFRIYHELIHLKSCKSSCLVAFRILSHDQTDIDCRWFHDLLEHARVCNPSLCTVSFPLSIHPQNTDCAILRKAVAHLQQCHSPSCLLCSAAKQYHEHQKALNKNRRHLTPSYFEFMSDNEVESVCLVSRR